MFQKAFERSTGILVGPSPSRFRACLCVCVCVVCVFVCVVCVLCAYRQLAFVCGLGDGSRCTGPHLLAEARFFFLLTVYTVYTVLIVFWVLDR
jgi:hypothetical protein